MLRATLRARPTYFPMRRDVYRYLFACWLPLRHKRLKVFTDWPYRGRDAENGRAAVADESLLSRLKANDERLAKLADPRMIGLDDSAARKLIAQSFPIYYITGTIHSPGDRRAYRLAHGAMAYRLAVDESPYIRVQSLEPHMIVLITPGGGGGWPRSGMVDVYRWHKTHPGENWPRLLYWGHYVAHDNNRDAMGMTLNLTRNILEHLSHWLARPSPARLTRVGAVSSYDNTVGDGPYNAWIDPLLADEWAMRSAGTTWRRCKNFGMPGSFHTW